VFELLTQVLLWLLIGYIAWFVLKQFIPEKIYTFLGFALLITLIVLAFFDADQGVVSEAWSLLSLPFRPLGIALMMLLWKFPFKDLWQWKTIQNFTFWALLILLISAAPFTAYSLNRQAESDVVNLVRSTADKGSGMIVVLAQDTTRPLIPPRTQIELTEKGDRLRYAAQLYNDQPGSVVVALAGTRPDVAGGDVNDRREMKEVRLVLEGLGIPASQLVSDDKSSTVHESATAVEKIITSQFPTTDRIVLVTSAVEMRRTALTFTKALSKLSDRGVQIIPRATSFLALNEATKSQVGYRFRFPQDILPDEGALYQTSQALQEQFLSVYYFLRSWMAS
jgi:uncharacterized SAM-binding protein YcdF (DUF218 family)